MENSRGFKFFIFAIIFAWILIILYYVSSGTEITHYYPENNDDIECGNVNYINYY